MSSFIIAKLNVRRTIGSRKGFISLVLLPILVVSVIIGLFGHTSDEIVPLAVRNEDGQWLSEEIVASVLDVDAYRISEPKGNLEQLQQEAYDGKWGLSSTSRPDLRKRCFATKPRASSSSARTNRRGTYPSA